MKTVFSNNELPHIWALQNQSTGKTPNGSFYFDDETIYSYGRHFPIATIKGETVFFTLRSYSNTTAKHIGKTRAAISHKQIIYCHEVPTGNFAYLSMTHETNILWWKSQIKAVFSELGNTKIRNTGERMSRINGYIQQLNTYTEYFKIPVKDKELKTLLSLAAAPDFLDKAREAKAKEAITKERQIKQGAKAFKQYINLWRLYDDEGIKAMPAKTKELANLYQSEVNSFTRLRFNTAQNRVETSKGVEIPAEIAKRAYIALNGCLAGECEGLNIPVLSYTITETGKDYIKAGCHTIPKEDITYIASLLKWAN